MTPQQGSCLTGNLTHVVPHFPFMRTQRQAIKLKSENVPKVKGDVDFIGGREAPGVIYSWSPQATAFWDTHSNTSPPPPTGTQPPRCSLLEAWDV